MKLGGTFNIQHSTSNVELSTPKERWVWNFLHDPLRHL